MNSVNDGGATQVVNGICVRPEDGYILMVRLRDKDSERECWIFPGGKVKAGESMENALERELKEELSNGVFCIESTPYPTFFRGQSPFSNTVIEVHFCEACLFDDSDMKPSREVAAFDWISPEQARFILLNGGDYDGYPVSSVTVEMLEYFLNNGNGHEFMT